MRRLLPKPLADADTATFVLLALLLIAAIIRLLLVTSLPLWLDHTATHDDAAVLRLATSIATGSWLGAYDQFTMLHGPGYPLFLAVAHASWLPLSLAQALFQTAAVAVAAIAVYRLTASRTLAAVAFLALAFAPVAFVPDMQRVIPAQIYWAQVLLVFSLAAIVLFAPPAKRATVMALSVLAGGMFGWAWITRPDSAWMLPGLAALAAGAFLMHRKDRRALATLARELGLGTLAAGMTILAVMGANLAAYGTFDVYDRGSPEFAAALTALERVESEKDNPFIPVPADVRAKVAKVSPSFAPLQRALDSGALRHRWSRPGCIAEATACGDYAGHWFSRALRDAAGKSGADASPDHAAQTFAKIAQEVKAACAAGKLACNRKAAGSPPKPKSPSTRAYVAPSIETVGKKVAFINPPPVGSVPLTRSNVEPEAFQRDWGFINRPYVSAPGKRGAKTEASGWYYDPASLRWPGFAVSARDGTPVPYKIERLPSPDLQRHFNDERPRLNRFDITYFCRDTCSIAALRFGHPDLRVATDHEPVRARAGSATLYVDRFTFDWEASADRTWLQALATETVKLLVPLYEFLAPLLLLGGLVVLLAACDGAFATRWLNPVLCVAAAAWVSVAAGIFALVPDDAASLVATELRDYAPATHMALFAAVLSCGAAVVQARRL
jgi:hypothetical protein